MYEFAITRPNKQLTDYFSEYKRLPLQLEKKLMFIYQGLVKIPFEVNQRNTQVSLCWSALWISYRTKNTDELE